MAHRIKDQMKNGRKIFKFLKFLDSIRGLQSTPYRRKPLHYKLMMMVIYTCDLFYYLLDHVIWGVNIGVLSELVEGNFKNRAKAFKDSFSLGKAMLKLIKVYLDYKMIYE